MQQVRDRIRQRAHIKGYASLLMNAAIESDLSGFTFDTAHESWAALVDLCQSDNEDAWSSHPNGITPENRLEVWTTALGIDTNVRHIIPEHVEMLNQRVIRLDIQRTRQDMEEFKDKEFMTRLEDLITSLCCLDIVNYKQGMNYLAAPILLLNSAPEEDLNLFHGLLSTMLPVTFSDDHFGGLQCAFRLFRLLYLYHDPRLGNHLDSMDMTPELFASPWLLTLMSNRLPMPALLHLWDCLILETRNHTTAPHIFHYFVWVALLLWRRSDLLKEKLLLPEKLNRLALGSTEEIDVLIVRARHLIRNTPRAVFELLTIVNSHRRIPLDSPVFVKIMSMHCIHIAADELFEDLEFVAPTSSDRRRASSVVDREKFMIVDCRSLAEFSSGHLPRSFHVDPVLYTSPESIASLIEQFQSLRGQKLCFLSSSEATESSFAFKLRAHFTAANFPRLTHCDEGYAGAHLFLHDQGRLGELEEHTNKCRECRGVICQDCEEFILVDQIQSEILPECKNSAEIDVLWKCISTVEDPTMLVRRLYDRLSGLLLDLKCFSSTVPPHLTILSSDSNALSLLGASLDLYAGVVLSYSTSTLLIEDRFTPDESLLRASVHFSYVFLVYRIPLQFS